MKMKKKRLSIEQWNLLNRLANKAGLDWFWLDSDPKTDEDYIMDVENAQRIDLYTGVLLLDDWLGDLTRYKLTPRDIEVYTGLINKIKALGYSLKEEIEC